MARHVDGTHGKALGNLPVTDKEPKLSIRFHVSMNSGATAIHGYRRLSVKMGVNKVRVGDWPIGTLELVNS